VYVETVEGLVGRLASFFVDSTAPCCYAPEVTDAPRVSVPLQHACEQATQHTGIILNQSHSRQRMPFLSYDHPPFSFWTVRLPTTPLYHSQLRRMPSSNPTFGLYPNTLIAL
jgi:hypothetical protein